MSLTGSPDPILIKLALVIRDLLEHDESLIQFGRLNAEQEQQNLNYIVIDSLGQETPMSKSESFNGTTEQMTYSVHVSKPVTVDFFGDAAYSLARKLKLLQPSQKSKTLQFAQGINMQSFRGPTDVRQLTGYQWGNRLQLETNVQYSVSENVGTLRIDEAVIQQPFLTN